VKTGKFDFSASWDVTENITLVTNLTNITGEPSLFFHELGSVWTQAESRLILGVRGKF